MAETDNEINLATVIKEQSETIKTLTEQFKDSTASQAQQPIYYTTPEKGGELKKTPNYALYAGIAIGAYLLFNKKRGIL